MGKQTRRARPGNAANLLIRCLLSDAGNMLGGLTNTQWAATIEYFSNECAYTGEPLGVESTDRDHAIPINKVHCGLHLYGNVLPCSPRSNALKHQRHYRDFVTDPARLFRIEEFIAKSGYWERVKPLGDLRHYAATQYKLVTQLCEGNREYLSRLLGCFSSGGKSGSVTSHITKIEELAATESNRIADPAALLIEFDPSPADVFKRDLLLKKSAWITIHFANGSVVVKSWNAHQFDETSNLLGNLRSRPQFRQGEWQRRGIAKIRVTTTKPALLDSESPSSATEPTRAATFSVDVVPPV